MNTITAVAAVAVVVASGAPSASAGARKRASAGPLVIAGVGEHPAAVPMTVERRRLAAKRRRKTGLDRKELAQNAGAKPKPRGAR